MRFHITIFIITLLFLPALNKITAQENKMINGYVYSAGDNSALKGIKVSTKFRKVKSAVTNDKGQFHINVFDSLGINSFMLTFSYPGYETTEQYGNFDDTLKVYMNETGDYGIDESVYFPYQNRKSNVLTSASEIVNFDYSTQVMSSSVEELLSNSTMLVTSASGAPGEGHTLNIRGYSTIFADEKPLVIVDGQILGNYKFNETSFDGFFQDPLINIDPRNVEAITIVKDAPVAALYGAKASNGVILIKTKSAKVGKTEFDITGHYGAKFMNKRLPVIQNSEYFKPYLLEQMYSNGLFIYDDYFIEDNTFNQFYKYNNTTDWQEYVFEPGKTNGININVRGGDAIAKYFFSGGYLHDEGSVSNTEFNRFNARFNADIDMTEWLTAQANLGVTYSNGKLLEQGLSYANPVFNSLIKSPFLYPYIIDSNNVSLPLTEDADVLGISNPYEVLNKSELNLSSYNFLGTLNFKVKISENMEANIRGSSELNKMNEFVFLPNHGFYNNDYPEYNQIKKGIGNFSRTSAELNLKYDRNLLEVHTISAIIGLRFNTDDIVQDISSGVGTPSDEFKDLETARDEGRTKSGYHFYRRESTSFLGLGYNFRDQYFIDLTVAADASSNIGETLEPMILGVPMAISPAIGLGWNISKNLGLNYNTFLNYTKLRLSAGQIANVVYDPYISKSIYSPIQYYTATGYTKLFLGNADLMWERVNKVNVGFDMAMLHHKMFVSLEVFYHNTIDILSNSSSQVELGSQTWVNNGNINTMGSELTMKLKAYEGSVLSWVTEISLSQYSSKAANFDNDLIYNFGNGEKIFRNGEVAGAFYGYEMIKVIASDEEATALNLSHSNGSKFKAGDVLFRDVNNDKIIDDKDKVVIGNPAPDFHGSWVNKFTYKQFSLLADITLVVGNEIYNHTRKELESMSGFENQSTATLRRWQVDGQETDIPASAWGDPLDNGRFSDRWIESGSYIRLKRITFSMDINKWLKSSNKSEIYISGINLITLDKYLGYDPEFSYGSSILWQGIDYCKFPQNRAVMVGVKLGL